MDPNLLSNVDVIGAMQNTTVVSDGRLDSHATSQPEPSPPTEGWHAEPQVNWLLATSPKKTHWLRVKDEDKARNEDGSKMSR